MRLLALWLGKFAYIGLRMAGSSGAALPGLITERLYPKTLSRTMATLPNGVIVVTGTNGKTTSTKMLSHILAGQYRVLTNPTGSNFTRGVVASIVKSSNWLGKLNYDVAVIELDEAYAAKFVEQYKPEYSLVLNVMRDQMDRFGEIDHTARLLKNVVQATTKTVILNADDPRVMGMASSASCKVKTFGVSEQLREVFITDDEMYRADKIGNRKNKANAELISLEGGSTKFTLDDDLLDIKLDFFGVYNSQNAVAVALTANVFGVENNNIIDALRTIKPAFGRGESIIVGNKTIILQLVKNPGGFRQALMGGLQVDATKTAVVINDNYADGRDVSWLWDVDFKEQLKGKIITSGSRAYDMAIRLTYDEVSVDLIEPTLDKLINELLTNPATKETVLIYSTYTAMLDIRSKISKKTDLEEF